MPRKTEPTIIETHVDIYTEDGQTEVIMATNDPTVQRYLEQAGATLTSESDDGFAEYTGTVEMVFSGAAAKAKREKRQTNRPEKTVEQRINHLFRLRKGKQSKAKGSPLTKTEEKKLLAYCTEVVMAKVSEGEAEASPEPRPEPVAASRPKRQRQTKREEPEDPTEWMVDDYNSEVNLDELGPLSVS